MKRYLFLVIIFCMTETMNAQNPLLGRYNTPHGTVPFDKIQIADYEPAIKEGIRIHEKEIAAIINNKAKPSFVNTIVALDNSGRLIERVSGVFENMLGINSSEPLQNLAQKLIPLLSEHSNNITLNEKLFARIKYVYDNQGTMKLNTQQKRLLEETYKSFTKRGANLKGSERAKYRELTKALNQFTLTYQQNCLKNTNGYELLLTQKEEIAGLPESVLESAAEAAKAKKQQGYLFNLQAPSYVAFMKYADNRSLREKLYKAYNSQGCVSNTTSNLELVKEIVNTRLAIAKLIGYKDYASFVLERRMAQNEGNVYKLLNQLLDAYTPTAHKEVETLEQFARETADKDFQLMPYDWAYYSNKLKEKKYHIDTEALRPYFSLDKVEEGIFGLANRLYGLTFKRNLNIPIYQKDVQAFEIFDKDGKYMAVLYLDFFPREGKQQGAWTSELQEQWKEKGIDYRPQIFISTNFSKPTATKPSLLTFEEVTTFLHEFGHSLHATLSDVTYKGQSGTNVYWDFVEMPSQFMENFATEKEFLHTFARHYQTGEFIPDSLIQKIVDADNFQAAYACLRQLSFGFLDMAWYTRQTPFEGDVMAYEKEVEKKTELLPVVPGTCMSTHFSHIFDGGYAAGYYSYKWAEVLEADAFSLFKQKGIFNAEVAKSLRENVLSKGNTEDPMVLYKRFRGQEPTIDALLIKDGIKK